MHIWKKMMKMIIILMQKEYLKKIMMMKMINGRRLKLKQHFQLDRSTNSLTHSRQIPNSRPTSSYMNRVNRSNSDVKASLASELHP